MADTPELARRCVDCGGRGWTVAFGTEAGPGLLALRTACPPCGGVGWVGLLFDEAVERMARFYWTHTLMPATPTPDTPLPVPSWEELREDQRERLRNGVRPWLSAAVGGEGL